MIKFKGILFAWLVFQLAHQVNAEEESLTINLKSKRMSQKSSKNVHQDNTWEEEDAMETQSDDGDGRKN